MIGLNMTDTFLYVNYISILLQSAFFYREKGAFMFKIILVDFYENNNNCPVNLQFNENLQLTDPIFFKIQVLFYIKNQYLRKPNHVSYKSDRTLIDLDTSLGSCLSAERTQPSGWQKRSSPWMKGTSGQSFSGNRWTTLEQLSWVLRTFLWSYPQITRQSTSRDIFTLLLQNFLHYPCWHYYPQANCSSNICEIQPCIFYSENIQCIL